MNLKSVSFDEVVAGWLRDEWHYSCYDDKRNAETEHIVYASDKNNPAENEIRLRLLKKHARLFLVIGGFSFLCGACFNLLGSVHWHIWFYEHTIGISWFGLPLEEYLTLLLFPHQTIALLLVIRHKFYA